MKMTYKNLVYYLVKDVGIRYMLQVLCEGSSKIGEGGCTSLTGNKGDTHARNVDNMWMWMLYSVIYGRSMCPLPINCTCAFRWLAATATRRTHHETAATFTYAAWRKERHRLFVESSTQTRFALRNIYLYGSHRFCYRRGKKLRYSSLMSQ